MPYSNARVWMALLALLLLGGCAAPSQDGHIVLKSVRGFHVGGERVRLAGLPLREVRTNPQAVPRMANPNGDYMVGQLYVQQFQLANPKGKVPVLLWHGGGLTGVTWEVTPDGRSGWQEYFLRAGFDTYVSDAVERGRASWARYPEINKVEPEHRTPDQAWEIFRFGPAGGYAPDQAQQKVYPGQLFPTENIDQFTRQFVARWTASDAWIQKAYNDLVQRVCPCIIIGHSQAGMFVFSAAQAAPDKVKAVVMVEPASALDPSKFSPANVKNVPHLVVWGDYVDQDKIWSRYRDNAARYTDAIRAAGGVGDTINLPAMGIRGNSHMVMMDKNSDQIAEMVRQWLAKQGLLK